MLAPVVGFVGRFCGRFVGRSFSSDIASHHQWASAPDELPPPGRFEAGTGNIADAI